MFDEAARLGGLSAQLCYWLGNEFKFTEWTVGAHELAARMRRIQCVSGKTKFNDAFTHIRNEHARAPIAAVIIIGDAVEENAHGLVDVATGLPGLFLFQENDNLAEFPGSDGMTVEQVFRRLADVTKGFYAKFDSSSASQLSGWLRATIAYATGGLTALEGRSDAESVKLLQHLKK
jgi:hypothetical protein